MKAKHVPSITRLSSELGLSRQWVSELFKLPDHPRPTRHGHNVQRWKAYISQRTEKIGAQVGLKSKLQIALLQARLDREAHDLKIASGETEEKITRRVWTIYHRAFAALMSNLQRAPNDLLPKLLVAQSPVEMRRTLRAWCDEARSDAAKQFESYIAQERAKGQEQNIIIPFEQRKAAS